MNGSKFGRLCSVLLLGAVALTSCGPGASSGGKHLHVIAVWGGDELKAFQKMIKPWEDRTGNKIDLETTRDVNALLTSRVQGGNPPDLAGLPGPGVMAQFARAGKLTQLDNGVLDMSTMNSQYAKSWLDLASVDGKLYGIFIKASIKGLIWYDPKVAQAAGISISNTSPPTSWDQVLSISQTLASAGKTPWCLGFSSGTASGWPGTDWIEDFMLRTAGLDKYVQWYQGKLAWTSPEVTKAWQMWGQIAGNPKMVFGGKNAILNTTFQTAADPLFTTPPGCYMHHQASFMSSFIKTDNPSAQPGTDYSFFGFPDINPAYAGAEEVAGDLFGMFKDSPEARDFLKYLTTPEAQSIWAKVPGSGALSPNKSVDLSVYPDALTKQQAQLLLNAKITAFDGSDQMPDAMNSAFFTGILDYVTNPSKLNSILAKLDTVQKDAYKS